ncbi:MAG: chemotaxis protein CheX [Chloroflexi bacterium]|nr:chemotaxis protein CheX [Chloroflexota bacterium]
MTTPLVLPPGIEDALLTPPRPMPRVEHVEPFLRAAAQVLEQELGMPVQRGKLALASGSCTTQDITAIVGITGRLMGLALYGMSNATALAIVSRMMGAPVDEMDDLALSGIGELGNVITGRATTLLAEMGLEADIAPPVLLSGAGSRVSTAGIQRLVVPLDTAIGVVEAQLAIKST